MSRCKWTLVAGLVVGANLMAQDPQGKADPQGKPDQEPKVEAKAGKPAKSREQWIRDLGSESFRVRLDAEKALRAMGKEAVPDLQKAAEQSADNEVQWRARRLVRQIEGGEQGGLQQRDGNDHAPDAPQVARPQRPGRWFGATPQGMPDDIRSEFDQMFEQMERSFGLDIPRARFFQDDFFQDLQNQLKAGHGQSHGMSMSIGPDGAVHVEVQQKNEKGEVETKTYDAPDMESFQKQYPGVLQQNGLGGGMQFWIGGQSPRLLPGLQVDPGQGLGQGLRSRIKSRLQPAPAAPADPTAPADQSPPDGKRLGVYVRPEIPADVREYLGLDEGVGLMVESVQPGSLAQSLGLQRGDIVTKVAGKAIGSTEDVQQALGGVETGKPVEVVFVRKGLEKQASANKPAAAQAEESPAKEPKKLEPRQGVR